MITIIQPNDNRLPTIVILRNQKKVKLTQASFDRLFNLWVKPNYFKVIQNKEQDRLITFIWKN